MKRHRRMLSIKEMNMIRHDEEVYNSRVKRGEIVEKEGGRHHISVCGCGVPGCASRGHAPHNPYANTPLDTLLGYSYY